MSCHGVISRRRKPGPIVEFSRLRLGNEARSDLILSDADGERLMRGEGSISFSATVQVVLTFAVVGGVSLQDGSAEGRDLSLSFGHGKKSGSGRRGAARISCTITAVTVDKGNLSIMKGEISEMRCDSSDRTLNCCKAEKAARNPRNRLPFRRLRGVSMGVGSSLLPAKRQQGVTFRLAGGRIRLRFHANFVRLEWMDDFRPRPKKRCTNFPELFEWITVTMIHVRMPAAPEHDAV